LKAGQGDGGRGRGLSENGKGDKRNIEHVVNQSIGGPKTRRASNYC